MLVRAAEERDEGDVDKERILASDLKRYLSDRLYERLGLYVAYGAADLGDDNIGIGFLSDVVDELLYLVRDMRNDLNRRAEELAAALLVENIPVDLSGRQIGIFVKILVDEALVVTEVKVSLGSVLRDVYLSVLIGAHRAGIDVYVGVELLRRDLQSAALEQTAERSRSNALPEPRYNASGDENVLGFLAVHLFALRGDPLILSRFWSLYC